MQTLILAHFGFLTSNMMGFVLFQATNCMAVYYSSNWKLLQCLSQLVRREVAGTCLVVQWLRLCVSNTGTRVQSLVGELDPKCCN